MTTDTIYVLTSVGRFRDCDSCSGETTAACTDEGFFLTEAEAASRADVLNKPVVALYDAHLKQLNAINDERTAAAELLNKQNAALTAAGLPALGRPAFGVKMQVPQSFEDWVLGAGYTYFEVEPVTRHEGASDV